MGSISWENLTIALKLTRYCDECRCTVVCVYGDTPPEPGLVRILFFMKTLFFRAIFSFTTTMVEK